MASLALHEAMHSKTSSDYLTQPHAHQVPPRWAVGGAGLGEERAREQGHDDQQQAPAHVPPRLVGRDITELARPSHHEAAMGMIAGMAYGAASPLAGHPFDTIKTKLQVDPSYRAHGTCISVIHGVLRKEGIVGLYRGVVPAVLGGTMYGGIVLSVYSGTFALCNGTWLGEPIPYTGGLRSSVLLAACLSGSARSVIETPLALMKVRRQTGSHWLLERQPGVSSVSQVLRQAGELYKGSAPTLYRSCTMLGTFFALNDYCNRLLPSLNSSTILGPFVKGGVCASIGWVAAWPFEVVKNRVQADMIKAYDNKSVFFILRTIMREEGVLALSRGIFPGLTKSFVSNGAAMIALHFTHRSMTPGGSALTGSGVRSSAPSER